MKHEYPEIEQLKSYFQGREISIRQVTKLEIKEDMLPVELCVNKQCWRLYVDDEYADFDEANPYICLYLILLSLEEYHDSTDFLAWCILFGLNSTDMEWLSYYKSLQHFYLEIELALGKVDSCLSSYDYTLRTGVVDALLALKNH